ncbi:S-layer homology domain-containing protein [Microbacteriaceae bacterium VKM Ac-2855]|nr:S-layer homology domain-containing protein [Microbacteriaceae bacterium VKM Ac-2855]
MRHFRSSVVAIAATLALALSGATVASADQQLPTTAPAQVVPATNDTVHVSSNGEFASTPKLSVVGTLGVRVGDGTPAQADPATGEIAPGGEPETSYTISTADGTVVDISGAFPQTVTTGSEIDATVAVPEDVSAALPTAVASQVRAATDAPVGASSAAGASVLETSVETGATLQIVEADVTPRAAAAGVTQPLYVAVVAPNGSVPNFYTDAQVASLSSALGSYWVGQTYGEIASIPLQATRQYTSAFGGCDTDALWNEALSSFGFEGDWQSADYNGAHVVVLTPDSDCGFIGVGSIGTPGSGGVIQSVVNIGLDKTTVAHEFGHNLGLGHSNTTYCSDPAFVDSDSSCYYEEYHDYYDVMAGGLCTGSRCWDELGALNVIGRARLGVSQIDSLEIDPAEPSRSWTATIAAASASGGRQGLEVVDPITGGYYYVEYRSGTGIDAGGFYASGESDYFRPGVRVASYQERDSDGYFVDFSNQASIIQDDTDPSFRPYAMRVTDTFSTQSAGLSIAVNSTSGTEATVTVTERRSAQLVPKARSAAITGATAIGSTLSIVNDNWNVPSVNRSYEWLRNGSPIGATGAQYVTVAADEGTAITAQVTASRAEYLTGSTTTNSVLVDSRPHAFSDVLPTHPFFTDIEWMASTGLSTGYDDGRGGKEYRPSANVTRQAMAAFLFRLSGDSAYTAPAEPSFSDVPTTHPYYREIEWMKAEGITTGNPDGTYNPNGVVSRQAMAAFLARMSGETIVVPATPSFSDVPTTNPFYAEIEWMRSSGISTGYDDGTYRPIADVSRQAMAAFLHRYDAKYGDS